MVDTLQPAVSVGLVPSPTNLPIGQLTIAFNRAGHRLSGPSSLSLTNNGGANLLTSAQTLTTSNNQTFVLGNLSSLTSGNGGASR